MAIAVEKRPLGALGRMGMVAALHVAALYVIARSAGLVSVEVKAPPIEATVIKTPQRDEPPPPKPEFERIKQEAVVLPQPIIDISQDVELEGPITAEFRPLEELHFETGTADPEPKIIAVRTDPRSPPSQPPYPAEMIRMDKEGVVGVEVLVGPNGRVADARIFRSSGFSAFDRSTLDEAKRRWRFLPATRDGVPEAQWHRLQVVFKLKNQ
jgi:periplasmic protein TonB